MSDLVSVIMPSYNTGAYIRASVESVLAQTYTNWELIIVDDCSEDNTGEIIQEFTDKRIRYFQNETNAGAAVSRNFGIRKAQGRWIAFLDSDDLWYPDKLEKQLRFMQENGYAFSYTGYREIDETARPLGRVVTGPKTISHKGMLAYCWPGCLTVMYDREAVGEDIQIADIRKNNDYAMWLKLSRKADCHLLGEVLAAYRKRSGSISGEGYLKLIKWHYKLFREGENQNPVLSFFYTVGNMVWGVWKKIYYVRKETDSWTQE